MGILDICLKSGRHVVTIMLICELGEINGESFGFSDIESIKGYRNTAFRINAGNDTKYITRRIEFKDGNSGLSAVFDSEDGNVRLPVEKITEIVSQE